MFEGVGAAGDIVAIIVKINILFPLWHLWFLVECSPGSPARAAPPNGLCWLSALALSPLLVQAKARAEEPSVSQQSSTCLPPFTWGAISIFYPLPDPCSGSGPKGRSCTSALSSALKEPSADLGFTGAFGTCWAKEQVEVRQDMVFVLGFLLSLGLSSEPSPTPVSSVAAFTPHLSPAQFFSPRAYFSHVPFFPRFCPT